MPACSGPGGVVVRAGRLRPRGLGSAAVQAAPPLGSSSHSLISRTALVLPSSLSSLLSALVHSLYFAPLEGSNAVHLRPGRRPRPCAKTQKSTARNVIGVDRRAHGMSAIVRGLAAYPGGDAEQVLGDLESRAVAIRNQQAETGCAPGSAGVFF